MPSEPSRLVGDGFPRSRSVWQAAYAYDASASAPARGASDKAHPSPRPRLRRAPAAGALAAAPTGRPGRSTTSTTSADRLRRHSRAGVPPHAVLSRRPIAATCAAHRRTGAAFAFTPTTYGNPTETDAATSGGAGHRSAIGCAPLRYGLRVGRASGLYYCSATRL